MLRRIISFLLSVCLLCGAPLTAYADNGGNGAGSPNPPVFTGGGASGADLAPVMQSRGYRITMTTSDIISDAGVQMLEGDYTQEDLDSQRTAIRDIAKTRYIEPGSYGLNFSSSYQGIRGNQRGLASSETPSYNPTGVCQDFGTGTANNHTNKLAWMIYDTGDNPTQRPAGNPAYEYRADLYDLIITQGPTRAAQDVTTWLADIHALYNQYGGGDDLAAIQNAVCTDTSTVAANMNEFTWATTADTSAGTPQQKVKWSNIGHLSACIYFVWLAERAGDTNTAEAFKNMLVSWATSGWSGDSQPIIMVEATSCIGTQGNGDFDQIWVMATMPYVLGQHYGSQVASQMFEVWDTTGATTTDDALTNIIGAGVFQGSKASLRQSLGRYWLNGQCIHDSNGRDYCTLLWPVSEDSTSWYGYFHNWTYYAKNPIRPIPPPPSKTDAKGTFTWDLTPKGIIDKTPSEEINESSTIYNLNVSQNGHNSNNYSDWEEWILGDGSDCNQIRFNIYHVSEALNKDVPATDYTYGQVKAKGKKVHEAVDRVTVGSGQIGNVPSIGAAQNGEEIQVNDQQLLDILKNGTGLTYTETIAGPIKDQGIRVSYEIYIDVKVNCDNGKWEPLGNDQVEYVEYRSTPGVYSWRSDTPDGYAEIKCGYFDHDEYSEPYEAMSGSPTTENLFFVSGGQEFVAQITYEYITDKDTIRNFEQKYSATNCEGYWTPSTKTFTDATTEEVQSWLNTWTGSTHTSGEFINSKACTQCGTVHQNGTGSEAIVSTSITGGVGEDEPTPGPYYTEISLHATHWDWSGCEEETDDETGEVICPGGDPAPDSVSGTAPHAEKERATRWSGTVKSYHTDWNSNAQHQQNQASIKWQQKYKDMNYAAIKDVHVWRLEKARVEDISQLTFESDDAIVAEADDLANAIFNVAEADTAKEGRMYYILHPENADDFVFKKTIPTRGCCHCFNHNAAEDMIASSENPNNMFEEAWCISDYLILEGIRDTTSLLYYQYETQNNTIPILTIKVSGDRTDNGYTITTSTVSDDGKTTTNSEEFRGYDLRGQVFQSQEISYNTLANADYGTEEKICQNYETWYGGDVESDDLDWGGYNGTGGKSQGTEHAFDAPDEVDKYKGKAGKNNWNGTGDKKIFKTGYQHRNQGEVNGYSTSSPQRMANNDSPFVLSYNDIDVHDVKVHNGRYSFDNSTIFYHNIISYSATGGTGTGNPMESEEVDPVYGEPGFTRDTDYSKKSNGINDIVIHNPVSAQYAVLEPLPDELDQRTSENTILDQLNEDTQTCPGKANACKYAHLNCQYDGQRYHDEDCYVEVRGTGLASIPVKGEATVVMKPVTVYETQKGDISYGYTGGAQSFTAPADGTYTLEAWGAQGGNGNSSTGGKGGYAKGNITLKKGQTLYIYVGQAGSKPTGGWNGGGSAYNTSLGGGGGGGATFISTENKGISSGSSIKYNGPDTGWKCTDGQFHSVVFDPGNTGSFTLYSNHKYELRIHESGCTYGKSSYVSNGWFHLYDVTSGDCLSCSHSCSFRSSPRYTLDLNANPINQQGTAGFITNNGIKIVGGGGGGGSHTANGQAGGSSTSSSIGSMAGGSVSGSDHGGGGGAGAVGGSAGSGCSGYGHGGTNYVAGLSSTSSQAGVQSGNGKARISYNIQVPVIKYIPVVSGNYEYDKTQGDVIPASGKPYIYTAPVSGYYSIHLYGGAGGGAEQGKPSAGGLGGYAAGQVYMEAGQKVLVTVGTKGSNAVDVPANLSGGYNGGGNGGSGSSGGHGGGGATDITFNYIYKTGSTINVHASGGALSGSSVKLSGSDFYWGPRMTSYKDHIYRVDYYGENLDKATFDTYRYYNNMGSTQVNNGTLLHSYITSNYAQLFWRINDASCENGQEFRVHANDSDITLTEVYVVDMNDRDLVAAGGGGADSLGGTLGGNDDGTGGDGGGATGENGYSDGKSDPASAGAQASSGYYQGIGQSATTSDNGGGGAGWYGGKAGAMNNSGGGGGSSNVNKVQNGVTNSGQNSGSGYAIFVHPGKGETENTLKLSCNEPHHAPNSNWHYYTSGWKHEGGLLCVGPSCELCARNVKLYSPKGVEWLPRNITDEAYIVQHDGELHITKGTDNVCDQCGKTFIVDRYSLDGESARDCIWRVTDYDVACFNTVGATATQYHYPFGDDTCYDPCLDDEKHKNHKSDTELPEYQESAQFIILDHDFEVYFPNIGDFYGNGAFGLENVQKPEGWSYVDNMDTTIWLKEKYCVFPFDVTYNGKTYLAGEKVMLGHYDEDTYTWYDDQPDTYRYNMHCLLNNSEASAANIRFVAVAKNTPTTQLENNLEDHNYTRYGNNIRAYHDASKEYYIDVVGRIGVLSILDTGDFRFSNFYKEATDEWRVDQVVHEVDLSKQNNVSVDDVTIFNDPVSEDTKGQNTWGLTDWLEPIDKLKPFPLTPGQNNVKALKNQAHRIGYSDYMLLVTIGNYYGENTAASNNRYKVQIQPYYYYYNLNTKEWTPVDVYIKDGYEYKMINKYESDESTADYNFYYNLNWEDEAERRMYTDEEKANSQQVQEAYWTLWDDMYEPTNIALPSGLKYLHGTANMLFLRDGNRTFIGTRYRYGENTEQDGRISDVEFSRQAQRWNFTLGLPSTAGFVKAGEPCTPENMEKFDMDNGIIVCALEILSQGTVWTLKYDGTPVGERSFYLFDNNSTLVSWEDAGEAGPEDKIVVTVYTDAKTSRDDLSTEGTH